MANKEDIIIRLEDDHRNTSPKVLEASIYKAMFVRAQRVNDLGFAGQVCALLDEGWSEAQIAEVLRDAED